MPCELERVSETAGPALRPAPPKQQSTLQAAMSHAQCLVTALGKPQAIYEGQSILQAVKLPMSYRLGVRPRKDTTEY